MPGSNGKAVAEKIDNPLYAYKFKNTKNYDEAGFFKAPFIGVKQTSRRPAKALLPSNETAADSAMFSGYKTRRKQTYNALMGNASFNSFSNTLENIHNDVHVQCGGNGIMSYISYAAFEPLFWLHHNNIDRLLAMWQAANPGEESYLQPDDAAATFQRHIVKDDDDDDDDEDDEDDDPDLEQNDDMHKDKLSTPLYPWEHPDGSFWTSEDIKDVRAIWKYGFGYPEVPCSATKMSETELDDFTTEKINELYKDIPALDESTTATTTKGKGKNAKRSIEARKTREWDANILIDQSELCGTFSVYLFLGNPPSNTSLWDSCKTKIGTLTLLGAPKKHKRSKIEAAIVPLTPALKKQGIKGNDDELTLHLKKNLVWRCWNVDAEGVGREIPITNLTTLKVAVTETNVIIPIENNVKPVFGNVTLKTAVTEDKKGGVATVKDIVAPKKINGKRKPARKGLVPIADKKAAAAKAERKKNWRAWKEWKDRKAKKAAKKAAGKKAVAKKPATKPNAKSPAGAQSPNGDADAVTVTVTQHGSRPTGAPAKADSAQAEPADKPAKGAAKPPAKAPADSPAEGSAKAPAKGAANPPVKAAANPPVKAAANPPTKAPAKVPASSEPQEEGAGGGY
ncbi:Tyrosinase [Orbilia brochopaga]|nr:Tyrosinase [Drechslerella brochopaga]